MSNALVVFSGGQDSTTCLYWARERFSSILALTFDYGQRHYRELESAKQISRLAGVNHETIDVGSIFAGLSPLTDRSLTVQSFAPDAPLPGGLADTFVPGRNILFLTIAANRAYVAGCDSLIIGVAQQDYGGYPDCREDFISKMELAVSSGLDRKVQIIAPLMDLTKAETVALAKSLPGCMDALALSTTCYNGAFPPCGTCHSCILRQRGFAEAGVVDPLVAQSQLLAGSKT